MKSYLRHDEFVQYAPSNTGQTVRINHESDDCSGSSKSIAIWRNEDDSIAAYCHRCGKSGRYSEAYATVAATKAKRRGGGAFNGGNAQGIRTSYKAKLPRDSSTDVRRWSPEARVWCKNRNILDKECIKFGIVYSDYTNSVYMPVYSDTELAGYVRKPFDEGYPKYIAKWNDKENALWINEVEDCDYTVLTEDIPSAIVVGRQANTIALLGVELTSHQMAYLTKYNKFVVWLDNDNPTVKMKQLKIKNKLSLFGDVKVIHSEYDPKNYSEDEIQEMLNV
jgi:hypothetical protein